MNFLFFVLYNNFLNSNESKKKYEMSNIWKIVFITYYGKSYLLLIMQQSIE